MKHLQEAWKTKKEVGHATSDETQFFKSRSV